MPTPLPSIRPWIALWLLLAINLFNYVDRYVLAAVEKPIADTFFSGQTQGVLTRQGLLPLAFLVSYFVTAPIFGWLADRVSRWWLVGGAVIFWSLASGGSGLAGSFTVLLITRMLVGVGEAGYGPAAPTIISDLFPIEKRGRVLAWFYMAIPVGSALGYVLGGQVLKYLSWRWAFLVVVPPGVLLGILALMMRDPPRGLSDRHIARRKPTWADYATLLRNPSYLLNCAGMTALTFAIGGISYFMPRYLEYRGAGTLDHVNLIFGIITAASGLVATLLGGVVGDWARSRVRGAYFVVSAVGILAATPMICLIPVAGFPLAWGVITLALFALFFNTGPSNTVLANVAPAAIRSTAFAVNIFVIHLLGDAISPMILGAIVGDLKHPRWNAALWTVGAITALAGVFWLWGARYLERDTARAASRALDSGASAVDTSRDRKSPLEASGGD